MDEVDGMSSNGRYLSKIICLKTKEEIKYW